MGKKGEILFQRVKILLIIIIIVLIEMNLGVLGFLELFSFLSVFVMGFLLSIPIGFFKKKGIIKVGEITFIISALVSGIYNCLELIDFHIIMLFHQYSVKSYNHNLKEQRNL